MVIWSGYNQPGGNGIDIFAQRYNSSGVAQGSEFRVNTYTTDAQTTSAIAMNASGAFIATWNSSDQPGGNGSDIYAQRYSSTGIAQ